MTTSDSARMTHEKVRSRKSFRLLARTLTMTKFSPTEPSSTTSPSSCKSGSVFTRATTLLTANCSPSITRGDPCSSCVIITGSWQSTLPLAVPLDGTFVHLGVQAVADEALPSEVSVARESYQVARAREVSPVPSHARAKSSFRGLKICAKT